MEITNVKNIYFLGIGGIGMSALAQWFHEAGFVVGGYDKTPSDITRMLEETGIFVTFNDSVEAIPSHFKTNTDDTLVVYTPAIPSSHPGLQYYFKQKYQVVKRSQALGMLVKDKECIAVAGTHGKTSVSSTLAYILSCTKESCSAFLGGVVKKLKGNVVINPNAELVVVEADEFDRSFLTLYPSLAVITAIDADHLDIYENKQQIVEAFEQFIGQVKPGGKVLIKKGVPFNYEANNKVTYYSYSITEKADFYPTNIKLIEGEYHFNLVTPVQTVEDIQLRVPGLYNLENAVAALSLALMAGANAADLVNALQEYNGVKRRFDVQLKSDKVILIDDYAHHPAEIEACVKSVRHIYPDKKITGIFQPHLFTRTRDFAGEFAQSLDLLDELFLLPIYPARELPIQGVTSQIILDQMKLAAKSICHYNQVEEKVLEAKGNIILMMGAGDIDRLVSPVKERLKAKFDLDE